MSAEFRSLTAADAPTFADFTCAGYRSAHALDVQNTIREGLAQALESGDVEAIGLFDDDDLIAIGAWREMGDRWNVPIVAVKLSRQSKAKGYGRGYGRRVKTEIVRRAAERGVRFVASVVAYENDAMIEINRKFGAYFQHDATNNYFDCVIDVAKAVKTP